MPYDTYWPVDSYPLSYEIYEEISNIILTWLADILLLKAEALVELNRAPEVIWIISNIKERAGFTSSSLDESMGQTRGHPAVENEHRLELYMEDQCWFDLVHNNRLLGVVQKYKNRDSRLLPAGLQTFRQLWLISQGERDKNTNLIQSEGY